jgi:hypothetical protein
LGIASGLKRGIEPGKDYSRNLVSAALLKTPAIHATRYTYSATLGESVPPGCVYWTDVSNVLPPDFDGSIVSRLFAEERTGGATTFYSPRKDAATLIEQLGELVTWINVNVPGGRLIVLCGDFASEAVRQSHGDAIYTAAMTEYCDAHPGFRFVPAARNSQGRSTARRTPGAASSSTAGPISTRGAPASARPAGASWSAVRSSSTTTRRLSCAGPSIAPAHALGGSHAGDLRRADHARLRVPVRLHAPRRKANAYRTPTDPVLYLHPATSLHAQLVFNLRSFRIMVVRSVALTVHPYACALATAASALHCPTGDVHAQSADAYAARLSSLHLAAA